MTLPNLEKIRLACTNAANGGFFCCLIKSSVPFNLKGTKAADLAEEWLKKQGLDYSWVTGRDTPDGTDYPRLEINWV